MSDDLSILFSSQARYRVLQTLFLFEKPLPIRHIESLTGTAIRSVQVALQGLVRERAVLRTRRGSHIVYEMNSKHIAYPILSEVFAVIRRDRYRRRTASLGARAQRSLEFSNELGQNIEKAKLK